MGALVIGVIIGALIAITKYFCEGNKKLRIFNWLCDLYTTVIRGIPMTVLLLLFFFVLFVSARNGVPVAIAAFGINSGAYMAELIRSGMVPTEVAQHCGFENYATFYRQYKKILNRTPKEDKNIIHI